MPTRVRMTSKVDTFSKWLLAGDVLLFDTIHPLSELIKFAENRPANHSALYLGGGEFAHVGRHVPGLTPSDPPAKPAARNEGLETWLKTSSGPYDRTVTALRHIKVKEASDARPVVERARTYTEPKNTTYNYVSLIALMVPSLFRTYKNYFGDSAAMKLMASGLRAVSQSLVDVLEEDAAPRRDARAQTLTCSEFVYRCFDEADAGLALAVTDPLGRWPDPAGLKGPSPGRLAARSVATAETPAIATRRVGAGPGQLVIDGGDLVVFNDSFRADWLGPSLPEPASAAPRRAEPTSPVAKIAGSPADARLAGTKWDLGMLAGRTILDMIRNNRNLSKYDKASKTAQPGDVFADLVTPRDLWSSPTLEAVAVLHRPPGPADKDLDGVPAQPELLGG
jgi:hypothetical protein